MKTVLGNEGKLSQKQITRLGGLIALICDRTPYDHIMNDLSSNGFVAEYGNEMVLTERGRFELTRLTAMAGLRPEQFTNKINN
jgi:hypothetical protein